MAVDLSEGIATRSETASLMRGRAADGGDRDRREGRACRTGETNERRGGAFTLVAGAMTRP
jgi:hypothetical protein